MRAFRWFFCSCVELSNGPFLSKRLKRFTESKYSKPTVPLFAKVFHINLEEASLPVKEYKSLHSFFIRELKENARTIDRAELSVVSPVDGVLAEQGYLEQGQRFVVKNQTYSLEEMLGSEQASSLYDGGQYMVLYLSPSHYHRFHAPLSGKIIKRWTLGSSSYPVNHWGLLYGKQPLSKNFRVISEVQSDEGIMAMVKVGAMNINSIELTNPSDHLKKGEEVGYFSFGSTIILLWQKDMVMLTQEQTPVEIKCGEQIATLKQMLGQTFKY